MLVGKMKAWLCAALAATASGFGSFSGDFVHNPCANPDKFTPEATLPGGCEGIQITDRDVCQNAGCHFSSLPQDADDPCDCDTQELADTAWAFVKVVQSHRQLFTTLARLAALRMGDFNA